MQLLERVAEQRLIYRRTPLYLVSPSKAAHGTCNDANAGMLADQATPNPQRQLLRRKLQPTVMLTVDHKQSLQLEVRFGGIGSHQTAACALVPHLSGAFLSVTARAGAARIAQVRGWGALAR